jgi:hypothetical protein
MDHEFNVGFTDAQWKSVIDYLVTNFNLNVPSFNIPPALLAGELITPF